MQFARHNRVLYVNAPLDRRTILHQKDDPNVVYHLKTIQKTEPAIVPVRENLWSYYPSAVLESINWLPAPARPLFSLLNKRNNRKFAASIKDAMNQLGFKDVILFNDNDIFRGFYMKELLKPSTYIYYSRDYLLGVDYWRKHGEALEPLHIAKADIAVANSNYLTDILKKYNPNSYYVGQGCDLSLFDITKQYDIPDDMKSIKGPVVGYVGALNSHRLDIDTIAHIARERKDWSIVLVGPEDEVFQQSVLHKLPNIHFLGRKELKDLPAYIKSFDVCINPQQVNVLTIGNYPLKIDEYLALGKPVVATATRTMEFFDSHTYLARNANEYVTLINKAITEDNAALLEQRVAFARSHSWENSVTAIYEAILNTA
ncbi:glycosyltransferase [Chitinophaga rhizophila]|uniref:glycosyltransferase n=1 Tax=Chitinophaga rhizophila TaxID=2866212 RepID=UPI001F3AB275|nr:glycosyltransferase [Chitinophaga rhizophila]